MSLVNCKLENSILKASNCGYTLQSVKKLYLANKSDVTAIERSKPSSETATGVEVATITLGEMAKWNQIDPSKNSASFTDTLNVIDAGGKYRTHTVSFSLDGKYDSNMGLNMDLLSLGEFIVVAVLADGNHILLGDKEVGLTATVVTNTGSASATEFSGIQVEMSADLTVSSAPLSTDAIKAIEANIAK